MEYRRAGESTWTNLTPQSGKTLGSFLSRGIVADGSLAGAYEVDFPDAAFAAGVRMVVCRIRGVANMLPVLIEIELDAVDYQDATAFGLSRIDQTIGSRATQTSVDTIDDFIDTEVAAIKAKTDNLPSDPADASDIAASFASVNAALVTIAGYIDTEVAAIKAKTDNLPIDPADASNIAASFSNITTLLSTLATYVDTEVAAIKAKTDNLPASPAAVSDIPTAAQIADAVLEESVDDHDNVAHSLAKYISIIKKANTIVEGTVTNAVTPTATSFSSNVNYPTGAFKHAVLVFTNAAAINEQNSPILGYVNTNGVFTVEEPFTVAPTVGDEFIIKPTNHVHSIAAIVAGVLGQETSTSAYDSGDVGYVLRQLFTLIESDGAGGWRYKASTINLGANAPAGWINAGAFANNAIGGDAIAASAVTKVTVGLFKYGDVQRWNSPANQIDVTITKV
jgi:hypothetical protein